LIFQHYILFFFRFLRYAGGCISSHARNSTGCQPDPDSLRLLREPQVMITSCTCLWLQIQSLHTRTLILGLQARELLDPTNSKFRLVFACNVRLDSWFLTFIYSEKFSMSLMTSCVPETFGYTGMDLKDFQRRRLEADQGSSPLRRLRRNGFVAGRRQDSAKVD
jgi:hypothetical protein